MITLDTATQNIGESAALLGWTLRDDHRWNDWYDPDRWGGMIGLMHHLAVVSTALEQQLHPRDWSELDRYSTIGSVAAAIFDDTFDLSDMARYFVEL